jgi:hypothetical protein
MNQDDYLEKLLAEFMSIEKEKEEERLAIEAFCQLKFAILDLQEPIENFWQKEEVEKIFDDIYSQMLEEFEKKLLKILDDEKFQETRNVLLDLVKQEGMKNIFIEDVKLQRKITLSNNIAQIYRASGKITKDDFFIKNIRIGFEKANNAELEELKNSSNEVADLILKQSEEIFYALRILDF